jgi:small conductance mechanosensitive channel
LLQVVASRLIRAFRDYMAGRAGPQEKPRVETLGRVFRHVATVVITIVAGTLILDELGISVAPILATAGVAGVAIGFGAQSLVKDYFTGFFLLLEDQIRQGDVVQLGDKGGVVEVVTLRYVRLRDFEGHVHFVPNGEIRTVTNRTREFATLSVDVSVGHHADIERAFELMREVGRAMKADAAYSHAIGSDLEISGVDKITDTGVTLRCRVKVSAPLEQWNLKREFLRRVKLAFDAGGIPLPQAAVTLLQAPAETGNPPPRAPV